MATPAPAAAEQPGRRPSWIVLTASEKGASHLATQAPNQDSVGSERAGADGTVAAVADGHGHSRHLRSARGSRLAVKIGCQVAQELADKLEEVKARHLKELQDADTGELFKQVITAEEITDMVLDFVVPEVVGRWRDAVLADVAADPFSDAEQGQRQKGDDPTIAYGSTLLLGVTLHDWLILAQIGDGDVVGVQPDGRALMPVPSDPQLNGLVTTSLCGVDARSDFRVAVVDTLSNPLLAVLLATDGYGNAQVVDQWPSAFSEDLAWMLKQRDVHWLASQLPSWAARCASSEGSADDTTVALLVSPVASSDQTMIRSSPAGGDSEKGPDETTIPAAPHADTVPVQIPAGHDSGEPTTVRQAAVPAGPADDGEPATVRQAAVPADDKADLSDLPTTEWEGPMSAGAGDR